MIKKTREKNMYNTREFKEGKKNRFIGEMRAYDDVANTLQLKLDKIENSFKNQEIIRLLKDLKQEMVDNSKMVKRDILLNQSDL